MAKILLTGSTGYIGRRLLPHLVQGGHKVICLVRTRTRFDFEDFSEEFLSHVQVLEADLLDQASLQKINEEFEFAYFLAHSMSTEASDFDDLEMQMARNFSAFAKAKSCKQIIYLSGIANDENLSKHLESRKKVEEVLKSSGSDLTVLRAAIIIGSGSASFEIIRDLVEKLPVMVAPKWLKTRCQPIAVRNVLEYLLAVLENTGAKDKTFDIGGPEILTYKEMLLGYGRVRKLKRFIFTLPVLTPRLSSLWLYFVTSTSFKLARSLVDSMKNEVIVKDHSIETLIPIKLLNYTEALEKALARIESNQVVSSWTDSVSNSKMNDALKVNTLVPSHGCFKDHREIEFERDPNEVFQNIWNIGGKRGWYYGKWLWEIRGVLDKMVGGVGLRRGRRNLGDIKAGDSLDFWRVLEADKKGKRLLLLAEMKLPGEAWLEFRIRNTEGKNKLVQTATFRPHGLAGRLYWYSVLPFHEFIFKGMANRIIGFDPN